MHLRTALIACNALALILLAGVSPAAATATWPGVAPCDDTLQSCLEATDQDVVEIASLELIDETLEIDCKGVVLRAAPGVSPVFASGRSIFIFGCDQPTHVTVEGMTLESGRIVAVQGGAGAFTVVLRKNLVSSTRSNRAAIQVRSGTTRPEYGPTFFDVSGNWITVDLGPEDDGSAIDIGSFQATGNTGSIRGNVIHQQGGDQRGAIEITNAGHSLWVEVIANHITGGDFNSGIELFQFADGGVLSGRVVNNLVSGQTSSSGGPAAISLNVSQGVGDVEIVNNTVVGNDRGLLVSGRADLGAEVSGVFANNIVADNDDGVVIDEDFSGTFVNEHNLLWNNGENRFQPGPWTLFEDPQLIAGSRLGRLSPAIDAGNDLRLPEDITTDLAGGPRRHGVVDLGAFESTSLFSDGFESGTLVGWSAVHP